LNTNMKEEHKEPESEWDSAHIEIVNLMITHQEFHKDYQKLTESRFELTMAYARGALFIALGAFAGTVVISVGKDSIALFGLAMLVMTIAAIGMITFIYTLTRIIFKRSKQGEGKATEFSDEQKITQTKKEPCSPKNTPR